MPGKVNPVMPEMMLQVIAFVLGLDAMVAQCGMGGNFELNTRMPLMAWALLTALDTLAAACEVFAERGVTGIEADAGRCAGFVEQSLAMATPLAPAIGYDEASALAREAAASGRTVREVAKARRILPDKELDRLLDPRALLGESPVAGS